MNIHHTFKRHSVSLTASVFCLSFVLCVPLGWAQTFPNQIPRNKPQTRTTSPNTNIPTNMPESTNIDTSTTNDLPQADISYEAQEEENENNAPTWAQSWQLHNPYFYDDALNQLKIHNALKFGINHSSGNSRNFGITALDHLVLSKGPFMNTLKGGIYWDKGATLPNAPLQTTEKFFFIHDEFEWHFHERFYSLAGLGWEQDKLRGLNHNERAWVGAGYYFVETAKVILQGEAGYHFDHDDFMGTVPNDTDHAALMGVEFSWFLNAWSYLTADFTNTIDVTNSDHVELSGSVALTFKLTSFLYFATDFILRFDNAPYPGYKKYDTQTSASIMVILDSVKKPKSKKASLTPVPKPKRRPR